MGLKDLKEMINRFSFAQMTSNSDGKTSASGTMGVLICTIGSISFLYGSIVKDNNILLQSVVFTGIGAGLLGYRKSQDPSKQIDYSESNTDQPLNS
jgi:hypothetical protein